MTTPAADRWLFPAAIFTILTGILITWAVATPLFASPDEAAHLYKAYATAHGEMLGEPIEDVSTNIRLFDVPDEMGQPPNIMCFLYRAEVSAGCVESGSSDAGESTAAIYPPFWYGIVGGGARLLGADTSQRVYRTVAAAMCAALIAAAFAVARRSRARALTPLLLLGLTPMTLFLSGSVNPNGFEIAAFLLFWALCLHLDHPAASTITGGLLVGGLAAATLLSRFAAAVWVVAACVVVGLLLGRAGLRRFANRRFLLPAAGLTAAAALIIVAWSAYAEPTVDDSRVASSWSSWRVIIDTLSHLPKLSKQMIGVLGWLDTELPWFAYLSFAVLTVVAVVGIVLSRQRPLWLAAASAAVLLVVVPVTTNVVSAPTAGLVWQGRYSLPLFAAFGVLGMLGWQEVISRSGPAALRWVRMSACGLFAVAEIGAFWQALRRFAVGAHGKIWLTEPLSWRPAVAPLALIALNAVLVAGLCVVLLAATKPPATVDLAHDGDR